MTTTDPTISDKNLPSAEYRQTSTRISPSKKISATANFVSRDDAYEDYKNNNASFGVGFKLAKFATIHNLNEDLSTCSLSSQQTNTSSTRQRSSINNSNSFELFSTEENKSEQPVQSLDSSISRKECKLGSSSLHFPVDSAALCVAKLPQLFLAKYLGNAKFNYCFETKNSTNFKKLALAKSVDTIINSLAEYKRLEAPLINLIVGENGMCANLHSANKLDDDNCIMNETVNAKCMSKSRKYFVAVPFSNLALIDILYVARSNVGEARICGVIEILNSQSSIGGASVGLTNDAALMHGFAFTENSIFLNDRRAAREIGKPRKSSHTSAAKRPYNCRCHVIAFSDAEQSKSCVGAVQLAFRRMKSNLKDANALFIDLKNKQEDSEEQLDYSEV